MKKSVFSKVAAAVMAGAMVLGTMASSAFAAVTNSNGADFGQDGKYIYEPAKDLGDKMGDCYGVEVKITVDDAAFESSGCGGGICANNDPFTWVEFGNEGSEKAIITDGKTIKLTSDKALFEKGEESQLLVEGWWGSDFTVDGIVYLDKDGNDLLAAPPADDTPTGDSAATVAIILAAVAALAVVATVSVKKFAAER